MKLKAVLLLAVAACAATAFARPCWRPGPRPMHHHHHCDGWGRGGRNFWPGFVGGVVGGAIASSLAAPRETVVVTQPAVVTQPVVVQQPVIVQQPVVVQPATQIQSVWVEGRYVDQVQPNGTVIRTWQPGHYEQRSVLVQ